MVVLPMLPVARIGRANIAVFVGPLECWCSSTSIIKL